MEDYSDYCDKEMEKLLAKQAKCGHGEYKIMIKCEHCGKLWSEKNLQLGLKNEIIIKQSRRHWTN